ncbi:MAG: AMP-binding protein [Oscillospiraceae bacterium]
MDKSAVKTLADLVVNAAAEYGDKTFVMEKKGGEIAEKSFSEFRSDSLKIASYLKELSGEKLHAAVIGPTSYDYLTCYFGTVMSGNVIVPLDAQLACEDIIDLLLRADISVLFYSPLFEKMIPVLKAKCPAIKAFVPFSGEGLSAGKLHAEYSPAEPAEIDPESLAAILYTSGTTGKSKGVMLAHRCLIDNAMCCDNEASVEDTLLTVLPIHHVYCFTCDILLSLRYGTTVCVNDSLLRLGANLKLFKPTIILLVPMIAQTIYKQIAAASKAKPEIPMAAIAQAVFGGRLKMIYSGGAYLSPEIVKNYAALGIPMAQGYGMTECSPRISTASFDKEAVDSVGVIVPGCQVKIVDGEIRAKSPSVMLGYYKDEKSTAEALTEDGWLCTGDLGYVSETNHIYITGRKKNLIILSNGENVSPEELENKFADAEIVQEVLVYEEDSVITAEIFPNQELVKDMPLEEIGEKLQSLVDEINKTLPSAKTIRRLRVRSTEFVKTTSKKIIRKQPEKGELIK